MIAVSTFRSGEAVTRSDRAAPAFGRPRSASFADRHSIFGTRFPALLELIDIQGAIITIDAMGTQTEIVRLIRDKKADYVLALKTNHPNLHAQVKNWFDKAQEDNFEGITVSHDRRIEKGHHRTEKRLVWAVPLSEFGGLYKQEQWSGLFA